MVNKVIKDYSFKPMKICKGRKLRPWYKLIKLFRHKCFKYKASLCNELFTDKNKIRFMTQIFRWFIKDQGGFRVSLFLKKNKLTPDLNNQLSEGDIIYLSCRTYKAAWKNLLKKLDIELIDYKKIKRRRYNLLFTFIFFNLKERDKNITLDITSLKNENFNILITLNSFYIKDFDIIIKNGFINEFYEKRDIDQEYYESRSEYEESLDDIIFMILIWK